MTGDEIPHIGVIFGIEVGARPVDRDPVDARVVRQVRDRSGQIINCVAPNGTTRCNRNAGGWPTLAQNRRALTLPASPNTVTASGYTNLELWLHRMSAQVEGRSPLQPNASGPQQSLSDRRHPPEGAACRSRCSNFYSTRL